MTTTTNTTAASSANTGSQIVSAVERFWAAVADRHPELPRNVVVITGSGNVGYGMKLGHWARDRWTGQNTSIPELFVGGECIHMGARQVAETIIHEAAHALLIARGDETGGTSRQFRYHTKKGFGAAAEELGLRCPDKPHPVIGFSACDITDETVAEYAEEIAELEAALTAAIAWQYAASGKSEGEEGEGGPADPRLPKPRPRRKPRPAVHLTCGCGHIDRKVPAAVIDSGVLDGLTCSECHELVVESDV